jgi:phospholipase/carboxylesterase
MQLTHSVWHPGLAGQPTTNDLLPTVIAIHGHGAHSQDLLGLAPYLAHGRLLMICPEAEFQIQPGMPSYTWFNATPDLTRTPEEFERVVTNTSNFISEAQQRYGADPDHTVVLGFSQGGSLAYRLALGEPTRFAGLAALSTWLPDEALEHASNDKAALAALTTIVQHGTADPMVAIDRGQHSRDRLAQIGVAPEYHEYDMEHQISAESLTDLTNWIVTALNLPEPPASQFADQEPSQ